jgi:exodeoxyribonuclease VII small subunit
VKKKPEEQTFEQALANLEAAVAAMEKGDVPLAELVSRYEEASRLLARCRACLDQAQMTVERLRSGATAQSPVTEPLAPQATQTPSSGMDD